MSIEDFRRLTDVQWRQHFESESGLFIAEGEKVIRRAFALGFHLREVLTTSKWVAGLEAAGIQSEFIYVVDDKEMESITGYNVHRGALASFHRPIERNVEDLLAQSTRLVILDGLVDHENVGAIFRSVAALGFDGVLLTDDCADPLYRRAIKTSMGASLVVPYARISHGLEAVRTVVERDFYSISFALGSDYEFSSEIFANYQKFALIFGSEGHGLSSEVVAASDISVMIPMARNIDSLNVAQTAAIALWAAFGSVSPR